MLTECPVRLLTKNLQARYLQRSNIMTTNMRFLYYLDKINLTRIDYAITSTDQIIKVYIQQHILIFTPIVCQIIKY